MYVIWYYEIVNLNYFDSNDPDCDDADVCDDSVEIGVLVDDD